MDRISGLNTVDIGGGRRGWRKQNAAAGLSGTEFDPAWFNGVQEELLAVVESAGLIADAGVWTQLHDAIGLLSAKSAVHVGIAAGTANAITVDVTPKLASWSVGTVLLVRIAAANTLAAPTLAADGLAAKTIVGADDTALGLGDLAAATWAWMVYDAALDRLMLMPTEAYIARAQKQPWFRLGGAPNNIPSGIRTVLTGWATSTSGNIAGTLNAGAGTFTAGVADAGTWVLEMCANTSIASSEEAAGISVNGAIVTQMGVANGATAVNDLDMACSCIVRLAAGDVVAVTYYQGSASAAAMNSNGNNHFSGTRVGI